jgi:hypothetical protein
VSIIIDEDGVLLDLVAICRLYELSLFIDLVYYRGGVDCWARNNLNGLHTIHYSQINRSSYIKNIAILLIDDSNNNVNYKLTVN